MNVKTVTVVGANGMMGSNVSAIFASFGGARVYMVSRDIEKSKRAAMRAVASVRADSIAPNLIPADYSMLESCVRESDLVFESVRESLEVKLAVAAEIKRYARDDAVLCSGTSGLSITTLAESYPERLRGRFFGVHMFNPPYHLTLCELTPTAYSDRALLAQLKEYLHGTLRRTVVEVKDSPAFLGNRVGFEFINRALLCAEEYKYSGGIDYIDAILGPFTGRSMSPLVTSDFVGLDVHKAIVDNIWQNAPDYARDAFAFPAYAQALVAEGKLGRKTRCGLYKTEGEGEAKRRLVYDVSTGAYRDKMDYHFPFAEQMKKSIRTGDYRKAFETLIENRSAEAELCLRFLLQYIVYALYAADAVGYDIHAADDVMATGFNWCPPMAMAEALSAVCDLDGLAEERLAGELPSDLDVRALLYKLEPSRYDYRLYFKSL